MSSTNSGPSVTTTPNVVVQAVPAGSAAVPFDPSSVAITGGTIGVQTIMQPLPKWQAAVAGARNGVRPALLMILGDSNVVGEGAGTGTNNMVNARPFGQSVQTINKLNRTVIKATDDSFFGTQNAQAAGVTVPQYDPRLVYGTGWANNGGQSSFGGPRILGAGVTAGDLTFTPTGAFDRVKVFYLTGSAMTTALQVKIDGSVAATVNAFVSGADGIGSATYSTTLGQHVVGFNNNAAGSAFVIGCICWDSSNPGIVLVQGGWAGARASFFVDTVAPFTSFYFMPAIAPDLTIINVSINDINSATPVATYQAQMDALVAQALTTGDAILVCGFPSSPAGTTNGLLDSYFVALRSIGAKYGVSVIDQRAALGSSWTIATARGYTYDVAHPNVAGHSVIAAMMADAAYVQVADQRSGAYKVSATLTPSLVAANTTAEQTFAVPGVAVGDVITVNKPTAQAGLGITGARVSSAGNIGVTFSNNTASGITPTAAEVYQIAGIR